MSKIIVTGANKGLGLEIGKQLAENGHHVIFTVRNEQKGKHVMDLLEKTKLEGRYEILDLESNNSIEQFATRIREKYDTIDILINNAGILDPNDRFVSFMGTTLEIMEKTIRVNFTGAFYLTQLLVPLIPRGGKIINIGARPANFDSFRSRIGMSAYRLSKLALHAFTMNLAEELRKKGVIVVATHPGWFRSDMGGDNAPLSAAEGAITPVWLAEHSTLDFSGKFYMEKQEIEF